MYLPTNHQCMSGIITNLTWYYLAILDVEGIRHPECIRRLGFQQNAPEGNVSGVRCKYLQL